jgi:hypothetical protein
MTPLQQEAVDAEREAAAVFAKIAAARQSDAYGDSPLIPDGFEADAARASELMRRAARLRSQATPPPAPAPPPRTQPSPTPAAALPTKGNPPMTATLRNKILAADRERAKAMIAEGNRLKLPGDVIGAAIMNGMAADDFLVLNDPVEALARQIAGY